jgi:hypothetical protein
VTTEPHPAGPGSLPARPPRSLLVHFGVDSAVAFLALIMLLTVIFGVPWGIVAIVCLVIGAVAAPYTRRAEVRALAARGKAPIEAPDTP